MSNLDNTPGPAGNGDWRAQRRAERQDRRDMRGGWRNGAPFGAVILIVLGLVLLAQNFGMQLPERWWAFFILIPAIGAFVTAQRHYQQNGGAMSGEVVGALISGAIFVLLWAAFFFGFDWGLFWPLLLVAIGVALLARDYWPRRGN